MQNLAQNRKARKFRKARKKGNLEKLEIAEIRVTGTNQHKVETPTKSTPASKKMATQDLKTGEKPGQTITDSND